MGDSELAGADCQPGHPPIVAPEPLDYGVAPAQLHEPSSMWTTTPDGSVADQDGRIVSFSREGFIGRIAQSDGCFLCGAPRDTAAFTDEPILPRWLPSRYLVAERTVTLPGGAQVPFTACTVPCCSRCQALVAERIERPMSDMVLADGPATAPRMFAWLALVYLKFHLRERAFRPGALPSDARGYEALHQAHSVVRATCAGLAIDSEALGSLVALRVLPQQAVGAFDYCDVAFARTTLVRFDTTAILAVMDDSGAAAGLFWERLEKISAPISELQLREILVELALRNVHLKTRPTFVTHCDLENQSARLSAHRPPLELVPIDAKMRGELLLHSVRHFLPAADPGSDLPAAIRSGGYSFLFDGSGTFIAPGAAAPAPGVGIHGLR